MPSKPNKTYGDEDAVKAIMGRKPPKHSNNLRRLEEKGFPKPVKIGYRTRVWPLEDVREFMAKLEAEANAPKAKGGRHA